MATEPRVRKFEVQAFSPDFMGDEVGDLLQKMFNRTGFSYHKYGSIHDNFPHRRTGIDNARERLKLYEADKNLEHVVDALNYLMIEFLCPSVEGHYFKATDSDESPGAFNRDGSVSHGKDS